MTTRTALVISCALAAAGCAKTPEATASAAPSPDAGQTVDEAALTITHNLRRIHFDLDSARLDQWDRRELKRTATILRLHPEVEVVAIGHTDTSGSASANAMLGFERARAVEEFLQKAGVPDEQVVVATAGEHDPLLDPAALDLISTRAWAANRRVEFRVLWDPFDAVDGSEDNFPASAVEDLDHDEDESY